MIAVKKIIERLTLDVDDPKLQKDILGHHRSE